MTFIYRLNNTYVALSGKPYIFKCFLAKDLRHLFIFKVKPDWFEKCKTKARLNSEPVSCAI